MSHIEYDVATFVLNQMREWVTPYGDASRLEALNQMGENGFMLVSTVEVAGELTDTFAKVKSDETPDEDETSDEAVKSPDESM